MPRRKTKYIETEMVSRADPVICNARSVKTQCTTGDHGRMLQRSCYAAYLE